MVLLLLSVLSFKSTVHCMLVEVNWLDIVLVIKPVVQLMVCLMVLMVSLLMVILVVNSATVNMTLGAYKHMTSVVNFWLTVVLLRIAFSVIIVIMAFLVVVRVSVRFRVIEGLVNCVLMEMNRLDVMLVIKTMIQLVVSLVGLMLAFLLLRHLFFFLLIQVLVALLLSVGVITVDIMVMVWRPIVMLQVNIESKLMIRADFSYIMVLIVIMVIFLFMGILL